MRGASKQKSIVRAPSQSDMPVNSPLDSQQRMGTSTKNQYPPTDTPPLTPSDMATTAHQLVQEIRDIYAALGALPSLAPGERTNALLTRLVALATEPYSSTFTSYVLNLQGVDTLCQRLRPLCSTAEGELESYWARRIIDASPPTNNLGPSSAQTLLHSFPYYQNYLDLSRLECSTLEAFLPTCAPNCRPSPCRIAFLGSGPLPLTSFCLLDRYDDAEVYNVDRDAAALDVSRELARRLGYGAGMGFACLDVNVDDGGGAEWKKFQVVFLAALVGMTTVEKMRILEGLGRRLEVGTLVVVRSAVGLRGVLYPVLELSDELKRIGFEVLVEVHPWTKVVNSVVVLRVRER